MIMHAIVTRPPLTSYPDEAGTEHAAFSWDQALVTPPRGGVMGKKETLLRLPLSCHPYFFGTGKVGAENPLR